MSKPIYYTTKEVADILGVHVETVRRYLREGRIKSVRLGNGPRAERRIPEWAIHEWERRSLSIS